MGSESDNILLEKQLVMYDEPEKEKWIQHYSSRHRILLVGEGDFSFAACLATAFGNATSMIATSLDSQDMLVNKYADANSNLDLLKEKGCVLLHRVDALTMSEHPVLQKQVFDRIVFNFPHTLLLLREHYAAQIKLHQELVVGFFKSAYKMVAENGEVHVTHKTAHPFDQWNIEELASEAGLYLVDEVSFYQWNYPGYHNKRGDGHVCRCDASFPIGACSTFKFAKL
ncbi:uncharacterized protein At4g26485-like [Chenopodium quinoa]|uniref:uncharacterized protein At4g26485-like n=1 Tax=Chenopodium quinoa TaxID=63459 RepID=UPI000B78BD62|nr:uncharacterized protein At4g26485-like [Chenopodium quinoa]